MKVIQIVPQEGLALYAHTSKKEAELRKKNRGTFCRTAGKKRNSSKRRHRTAPDQEWQLLSAFLGFIDRHFGKRILAITIHYRWRTGPVMHFC